MTGRVALRTGKQSGRRGPVGGLLGHFADGALVQRLNIHDVYEVAPLNTTGGGVRVIYVHVAGLGMDRHGDEGEIGCAPMDGKLLFKDMPRVVAVHDNPVVIVPDSGRVSPEWAVSVVTSGQDIVS